MASLKRTPLTWVEWALLIFGVATAVGGILFGV